MLFAPPTPPPFFFFLFCLGLPPPPPFYSFFFGTGGLTYSFWPMFSTFFPFSQEDRNYSETLLSSPLVPPSPLDSPNLLQPVILDFLSPLPFFFDKPWSRSMAILSTRPSLPSPSPPHFRAPFLRCCVFLFLQLKLFLDSFPIPSSSAHSPSFGPVSCLVPSKLFWHAVCPFLEPPARTSSPALLHE